MANTVKKLSLYYFQACPYCLDVRKAIAKHGMEVELKDIRQKHEYRAELLKQGGKLQVPCLRIEKAKGQIAFIYESKQIIQYFSDTALGNKDVA